MFLRRGKEHCWDLESWTSAEEHKQSMLVSFLVVNTNKLKDEKHV